MASDTGASRDGLDERLAAARDGALLEGEQVVAQEMGDQGQAIVLTKSRILIIKAGLTATGTINGQRVSAYRLGDVETVKVRKGPMGAVIQVCGTASFTDGESPDNVVVFGDAQKVKRCEGIASKIEEVLGKPVEKIEAAPDPNAGKEIKQEAAQAAAVEESVQPDHSAVEESKPKKAPRRGIKKQSLAEEIYAEMTQQPPQPEPAQPVQAVEETPDAREEPASDAVAGPASFADNAITAAVPGVEAQDISTEEVSVVAKEARPKQSEAAEAVEAAEVAESAEAQPAYNPNPYLPKPAKPKSAGPSKAVILLAGLAALVTVGVCVTQPLREPVKKTYPVIDTAAISLNTSTVQSQLQAVDKYRSEVVKILAASERQVAAYRASISSGDKQAAMVALKDEAADRAWQELQNLDAPAGLAGAAQKLVSGSFALKSALADAAVALQSSNKSDLEQAGKQISQAERTIDSGLAAVSAMRSELERELKEAKHVTKDK